MTHFFETGPSDGWATLLLTHGASEQVDSPFQTAFANGLSDQGVRVARFEFAYLAARREGGSKRPPPRTPVLEAEFAEIIANFESSGPLFLGGKSMGGRIASLIADEQNSSGNISGIICLGYPFHPVGKPEKLRTAHLENMQTPALICQGTRDPFGTTSDVAGYSLSKAIEIEWLEDGDHGFKPRKSSGRTLEQNLQQAVDAACQFMKKQIS